MSLKEALPVPRCSAEDVCVRLYSADGQTEGNAEGKVGNRFAATQRDLQVN